MKNDIIVEVNVSRLVSMLLQKLVGLLIIIASVAMVFTVLEGDGTILLITVPLGCIYMFSKERIFRRR